MQIRDRELEGRDLLEHARAVAGAARRGARARVPVPVPVRSRARTSLPAGAGAPSAPDAGRVEIVVNRRLDVALAIDADGVHLGFDALAVDQALDFIERHGGVTLVGVSAHSEAEVAAAARAGAGYAHLAPIHAPLSKAAERPSLGLGALADACRQPIAVIAQGGVTATGVADLVAAGAAGVAVSGAILMADDPGRAAAALRRALDLAAPVRSGRSGDLS